MVKELTSQDIAAFRGRMIEVATRLFAERGLDEVSLRAIAAEAGVSRQTPYRYFRDKQDILDAVRIAALGRLTEQTRAAMDAAATLEERLAASGDVYCRFALAEPNAYALLFGRIDGGGDSAELRSAVAAYREVADAPLLELHARGAIRGDPDEAAQALWAALHGLLSLHLAGKLTLGADFAGLRRTLMDILAFGLLAKTPQTPQTPQTPPKTRDI